MKFVLEVSNIRLFEKRPAFVSNVVKGSQCQCMPTYLLSKYVHLFLAKKKILLKANSAVVRSGKKQNKKKMCWCRVIQKLHFITGNSYT